MAKFRKKPVVIEAEQFFPDKHPWPDGVIHSGLTLDGVGGAKHNWEIMTLEGPFVVTPGDWIITGVKGEKYPCKPDIFEATYDPVQETDTEKVARLALQVEPLTDDERRWLAHHTR